MLFFIIVGIAAGFVATRVMRVEADLPTTVVIGIVGSMIGWLALRFILTLTGMAAGFFGAVLGAMALMWLYKIYTKR